jgi:hypothetical protein
MKTAVQPPELATSRRRFGIFYRFTALRFTETPLPLPFPPATPFSPPSGPTQRLFQGPPAKSKFLAAKRHTYAKAEIAEYWVLDVNSLELHVFLNPWEGDYTQHTIYKGDAEVVCTTIADLKVSVRELLPGI